MTSLEDRVEILESKHKELDQQIEFATEHYEGDMRVSFLKKTKLKIKDELTRLKKLLTGEKIKLFNKSDVKYFDGDNT
jgi:hypothetical protein